MGAGPSPRSRMNSLLQAAASVANGSVSLYARAFDAASNQGTSATVTVQVANGPADTTPPVVTSMAPTEGATVSGTVSLAASATDNVAVTSLGLYVDGKLICTAASSATCSWNTKRVAAGTHSVSATAKDAAGNAATKSASVTVAASTNVPRKK